MLENDEPRNEMYHAMTTMARTGGYRERVELLQAVDKLRWFDNFGCAQYTARLDVIEAALERGVAEEDIPDSLIKTIKTHDRLSAALESE